jgi:hypothetical protein
LIDNRPFATGRRAPVRRYRAARLHRRPLARGRSAMTVPLFPTDADA